MSVAHLDEADLYYEIHGDGPPLVFIHGAGGSHLAFWQQVPFFQARSTCLIYDQRGFGRSTAHGQHDPTDGTALLRDLEGLLDHTGLSREPLRLVGQSLGTLCSLGYAANHPERVAAVVLSAGIGGLVSPEAEAAWARIDALGASTPGMQADLPAPAARSGDEQARFGAMYQAQGPLGPTMIREEHALTYLYAELAVASAGPPLPPLLRAWRTGRPVSIAEAARLTMPVLLINGAEDPRFPPETLEAVARRFPDGRHRVMARSGHSPYFHRAEEFNRALQEFFEGYNGGRSRVE